MIGGDAVEDIDHSLRKRCAGTIGLIIENLGLGRETGDQFEVHDGFALTITGGEGAIDIDILHFWRSNTGTGGVVSEVLGIVGIAKLGYANRHALTKKTLLVELVDLIGGGQLAA